MDSYVVLYWFRQIATTTPTCITEMCGLRTGPFADRDPQNNLDPRTDCRPAEFDCSLLTVLQCSVPLVYFRWREFTSWMTVNTADANGLRIRACIGLLLRMWLRILNQNPRTDANSKFEDPHISRVLLAEVSKQMHSVYTQVLLIISNCAVNGA